MRRGHARWLFRASWWCYLANCEWNDKRLRALYAVDDHLPGAVDRALRRRPGPACIAIGVWLTTMQQGNMIYYGAILVGVSSILQGLYCLASGTRYSELPKTVHVVTFLVGLGAAFVFMAKWVR